MAPVEEVIQLFEGKARRLLWLPPITLGYIFTISGLWIHFSLAVFSIGGAKMFYDLTNSNLLTDDEDERKPMEDSFHNVNARFSTLQLYRMLFLTVGYLSAIILAVYELYVYFDYENAVLVALAGIYWGSLVVVLINPRVADL